MKSLYFLIITMFFIGCGGGSSSSTQTTTGILIDSAVSGVTYSCSSTTDITDTDGKFTCPTNSTVSFTIGGVDLGSVSLSSNQSSEYFTPARLYGLENNNISDIRILNFIQLIQSLDTDNNASNGIDISLDTRDDLVGFSLDISSSSTVEDDLNTTLTAIGRILISSDKALEHYVDTLQNTLNITFNPEPYYYQQWYLEHNSTFYSQNSINENAHIHVGNLLKSYTGKGIKIAIIDDGLDVTHEDLKGSVVDSYDVATKTTTVAHTNQRDYHGTAVTGIIGARVNSKGIQGIASKSQIIFLKHKKYMSDSETIELFNKADEFGADIINCSWGTYDVSQSVKDKIVDLANNGRDGKGTIIVFASGNDDQDMSNDESSIPEVISVGSTDKDNLRARYSNYGENLDIVAPGGYVIGITTLDNMGDNGISSLDNNYILYNDLDSFVGTSASAPIVSGVIGLMLEKNPNLTRVEIEDILKNSSDKIGNLQYENGRNNYYGYGKINLTKIMED